MGSAIAILVQHAVILQLRDVQSDTYHVSDVNIIQKSEDEQYTSNCQVKALELAGQCMSLLDPPGQLLELRHNHSM